MAASGRKNADAALLASLAGGATVRKAAARAGVSERTAYRRLREEAFRRRVAQARGDMVSRAVGKLADASARAVDTLRGLLSASSETARLGAARSILELGARLREAGELEERLRHLEERLERQ
jgi:hypothetical protein